MTHLCLSCTKPNIIGCEAVTLALDVCIMRQYCWRHCTAFELFSVRVYPQQPPSNAALALLMHSVNRRAGLQAVLMQVLLLCIVDILSITA